MSKLRRAGRCSTILRAAKIHPMVSEQLDTKTQMRHGVASNAWLEPEQMDEGLETTPTVACNDWSAMLPNLFFCIQYSDFFSYNKLGQ